MIADHEVFTYGIEEEFFLVSPRTRNVVARVPKRFIAACRRQLGGVVHRELLQAQIELASPVFDDGAVARTQMTALRRGAAAVAADFGLALVASGTHPLATWREQHHTDSPRYLALEEDFQIVSRRSLVCGLHVHVGVPEGIDRVNVMNRALPWLPLFLALSASSPFWNRQRTGLMSYRQVAYDEWPRTGIPDYFADEAEYARFAQLLVDSGAMPNASYLWWAIRPHPTQRTIELRICDACPRLDDTLALAALFRCLIAGLATRATLGGGHDALTRRVIDENRWRAKRWGTAATLIDPAGGAPRALAEALAQLSDALAPEIAAFDCATEIALLPRILAEGNGAQRQLTLYRARRDAGATRSAALRTVVDDLIAVTMHAS